jgi:hypothetical protein
MAAYAKALKIDNVIVGKAMDFWKSNMPRDMILRSACDWHLDPLDIHTIENYLEAQKLTGADVEPLSRDFYLGYARWFQNENRSQSRRLSCSGSIILAMPTARLRRRWMTATA